MIEDAKYVLDYYEIPNVTRPDLLLTTCKNNYSCITEIIYTWHPTEYWISLLDEIVMYTVYKDSPHKRLGRVGNYG